MRFDPIWFSTAYKLLPVAIPKRILFSLTFAITLSVYESEGVTRRTTLDLSNVGTFIFIVENSGFKSDIYMTVNLKKSETLEVGMIEQIVH